MIDPGITVEVDQEDTNLATLLADLTQFVTAESLAEESVLFTNPQNVQDLRRWVAAEGSFASLSGRRLRRTMNTLIRGKPIHSHLAERLVNLGNRLKIRGAHNEKKERIAAKVCAAANGTKNDWKAALDKYEEDESAHLKANIKPAVHWRDALTGSANDKHRGTNMRNKAIIALSIRRFDARAKAADAVKDKAFAHAAANKAASQDRKGVIKAVKAKTNVEKVARVKKRKESNRMKQISESTRAARAVACDPVRVDLGKINLLTSIPVKSILAEECRLRGMGDASAEETQAGLIERLSTYHKLRNEHPTLIPEMTVEGKAKTTWRDRAVAVPEQNGSAGYAI